MERTKLYSVFNDSRKALKIKDYRLRTSKMVACFRIRALRTPGYISLASTLYQ